MQPTKQSIDIDQMEYLLTLFGTFDENAKLLEELLYIKLYTREHSLSIEGEDEETVELASVVIHKLLGLIAKKEPVGPARVRYAVELAKEGQAELIDDLSGDVVTFTHRGRQIKTKTIGQRNYIRAIREKTVVFGIGPAGTGKTYLAVAMAVMAYKNKDVSKIILTRPAVEAGEKLGFLPGDLQNKVDPYLRPLYDALTDFLGMEQHKALVEKGVIEVAPLAYMRGRTLNDAFIILDEAQNCTVEQMKMFLTRFGEGSRVVVTGDVTQIDLPKDKRSGLIHAAQILENVKGIGIIRLTARDVVRHEMVQRIIRAYEQAGKRQKIQIQRLPKA